LKNNYVILTLQYPAENEFMNFLSLNGGYTHAYTTEDQTNYFFEISKSLVGAIDRWTKFWLRTQNQFQQYYTYRFAQFFIAPRFDRKSLEREAMAVDSEYKNTLQNDDCRLNHVVQSLAKPGHPYTNFKCGNHDSLLNLCKVQAGVKVTRLIMNFSSANYSKKSHEIFSLTLSTCCGSSTTTSTRRT